MVRLGVAIGAIAAMMTTLLGAAPAGGASSSPDAVCALLDRADVREQISAAGELALKLRCGLISPADVARPNASGQLTAPLVDDTLVNDRSTDTWTHITQSETTVAVNRGTMLVGYNDSGEFGTEGDFSGYARSTDGGVTFTDLGQPTTPLNGITGVFGDPVLYADRDRDAGDSGVYYFANLAETSSNAIISVHRTQNNGTSWAQAANASPSAGASFPDKEWLAVDSRGSGTGAGNVYVCYRRFGNGDGIRFSRSTNHGTSFTEIGGNLSANPTSTQGCFVAVNRTNGEVYVIWQNSATTPRTIRFRKSTDGGSTFAAEATIATYSPSENNSTACGRPAFVDDEAGATSRAVRSSSFPYMAVDPIDGDIAVVFHAAALAGGSESDIAIIRSTDDGATWSPPARINASVTGQQFFGSIAINKSGKYRAMWYSTQNSATDRLIDVYSAVSNDGGVTWGGSGRITNVSFDRPITNPNFDTFIVSCYMGDYNSIGAAEPGMGNLKFRLTWGDNRLDGNPGMGGVQPDPDVRFERKN